jgi:hypothetical protein
VAKRAPPEWLALSPSETTPLLLDLVRHQAGKRRPADLLVQLQRDGFVAPGPLDQRTAHRFDGLALDAAAAFEAVLLSPVAPLGACSALAPTSQDRTLTALRGTEVVSDPTNVLALLCAKRLQADAAAAPRFVTLHQTLRAQALPKQPGFSRHFRLMAMGEAGLAQAEHRFERAAIQRQLGVFIAVLAACEKIGCAFPRPRAQLFVNERARGLGDRVEADLRAAFAGIALERTAFESRYYDGLRLLFGASSRAGDHVPFADIGVFDWVGKLTANRRLRYVASALGIQLFPLLFME